VLLLVTKPSELAPREKVAAPCATKVPETFKFPPMPTFPRVDSVETVREPVTLLVPLIDIPPLPFAIWPDDHTCEHLASPIVEIPVTDSVPVEVKPAEVSAPAKLALPEETVSPLVEVKPAEVSAPAKLAFPEATVSPLDEVRPAQVNVPRMDEFPLMAAPPLETVKPADVESPAQVIAAVGSIPTPIMPMRGPEKVKEKMIGDIE